MSLKNNLVSYMRDKRISIRDLSEITGVSEPTLKRLRTQDNANPTLDVLMRLSLAFDISLDDLVSESNDIPIFYQHENVIASAHTEKFMLVFTKNTFSFRPGSKAIFRKHKSGMEITKYFFDKQGLLFEKVGSENQLYRDENYKNFIIKESSVFAVILKELYEVSYV